MATTSNQRQSAIASVPKAVVPVAAYGASASVIVPSAEGVTIYQGAEGDPTEQTLRWLDGAFDGIQERHDVANASLLELKPGH